MKLKQAPASFKASDTADAGTFEAIVSVFNNKDSAGDVVLPGAFKDTIAEWAASPDTLPVLWSHNMADPAFNIGGVEAIEELEAGDPRIPEWADPFVHANGGLWVRGRIDTGDDASPVAKQALRLLKQRRVTQFSYAYDVIDGGWITHAGEEAYALKTLKLFEVSPTQVGANQLTELLGAKRFETSDGRATDRPAKPTEEPDGAKVNGEEPSVTAHARLLIDLAEFEVSL